MKQNVGNNGRGIFFRLSSMNTSNKPLDNRKIGFYSPPICRPKEATHLMSKTFTTDKYEVRPIQTRQRKEIENLNLTRSRILTQHRFRSFSPEVVRQQPVRVHANPVPANAYVSDSKVKSPIKINPTVINLK